MATTTNENNSFLHERKVAARLSVSVFTLRRWRARGKGPTFIRIGGVVCYGKRDLDKWLASRPAGGERVEVTPNA